MKISSVFSLGGWLKKSPVSLFRNRAFVFSNASKKLLNIFDPPAFLREKKLTTLCSAEKL
jgi:hypothetical protein